MLAGHAQDSVHSELTPWLTARMSPASFGSATLSLLTVKWKAAGSSTAITESVSSEEFNCVEPGHRVSVQVASSQRRPFFGVTCHADALIPKPCSENRVPPAKKHMPSTSTEGKLCQFLEAIQGVCMGGSRRLLRIDPTTGTDSQRSIRPIRRVRGDGDSITYEMPVRPPIRI